MNFCPETDKLFNVEQDSLQHISKLQRSQRSIIDNVSKHFMYNFCVSYKYMLLPRF